LNKGKISEISMKTSSEQTENSKEKLKTEKRDTNAGKTK
jgi:hypothetical protein